jgi:hypothetical protein
MKNTAPRDAKRIIHGLHNVLSYTPIEALPFVAKGLAKKFSIPQKIMLQAMERYTRIYCSK